MPPTNRRALRFQPPEALDVDEPADIRPTVRPRRPQRRLKSFIPSGQQQARIELERQRQQAARQQKPNGKAKS